MERTHLVKALRLLLNIDPMTRQEFSLFKGLVTSLVGSLHVSMILAATIDGWIQGQHMGFLGAYDSAMARLCQATALGSFLWLVVMMMFIADRWLARKEHASASAQSEAPNAPSGN